MLTNLLSKSYTSEFDAHVNECDVYTIKSSCAANQNAARSEDARQVFASASIRPVVPLRETTTILAEVGVERSHGTVQRQICRLSDD
jgi:hypothetical protein